MTSSVPIMLLDSHGDARCPKCYKPENIVEMCRNCGHLYDREPMTAKDAWIVGAMIGGMILIVVWIAITGVNWLGGYEQKTLLEVLRDEWEWLTKLRIW